MHFVVICSAYWWCFYIHFSVIPGIKFYDCLMQPYVWTKYDYGRIELLRPVLEGDSGGRLPSPSSLETTLVFSTGGQSQPVFPSPYGPCMILDTMGSVQIPVYVLKVDWMHLLTLHLGLSSNREVSGAMLKTSWQIHVGPPDLCLIRGAKMSGFKIQSVLSEEWWHKVCCQIQFAQMYWTDNCSFLSRHYDHINFCLSEWSNPAWDLVPPTSPLSCLYGLPHSGCLIRSGLTDPSDLSWMPLG